MAFSMCTRLLISGQNCTKSGRYPGDFAPKARISRRAPVYPCDLLTLQQASMFYSVVKPRQAKISSFLMHHPFAWNWFSDLPLSSCSVVFLSSQAFLVLSICRLSSWICWCPRVHWLYEKLNLLTGISFNYAGNHSISLFYDYIHSSNSGITFSQRQRPAYPSHNSGRVTSPSFNLIWNTALDAGIYFQIDSFNHSVSLFVMSPSITIFFFLYFTFSCGPCFGSTINLVTHISIGSCLTVLSSFSPCFCIYNQTSRGR